MTIRGTTNFLRQMDGSPKRVSRDTGIPVRAVRRAIRQWNKHNRKANKKGA